MLRPDCVPESVDQTAVVTSASTRTDNVRGNAQTVTSDVIGSVEAASRLLRLHPPFSSDFCRQFCVARITGSSLCELSSRHVSKVILSCHHLRKILHACQRFSARLYTFLHFLQFFAIFLSASFQFLHTFLHVPAILCTCVHLLALLHTFPSLISPHLHPHTSLHFSSLLFTSCHFFTLVLHFFKLVLHFFTLLHTSLHFFTLLYTSLHFSTFFDTSLDIRTLPRTSLHFFTQLYIS